MKIAMTLLVRDEEDILDANLAFHLDRGVDVILVTDNNSVDATPGILRDWERTGRVHVIRETGDDRQQDRWVTRMARLAAVEFGADWVLHNDADQFWWPEEGDLRELFAAIPDVYGVVRARKYDFLPRPDGPVSFADRLTVRESALRSWAVAHRASPDVMVRQGNHNVSKLELPRVPWVPLVILHFPIRSYAQWENKVRVGGAAYQRNARIDSRRGRHNREAYDHYLAGELPRRYAERVLDDAAVADGVRAGRLEVDRRLALALAELRADTNGSARYVVHRSAWPDPVLARPDLTMAIARAAREQERARDDAEPVVRSELKRMRRELAVLRKESERLAAIEASRWWRLRPRLPRAVERLLDSGSRQAKEGLAGAATPPARETTPRLR